MQSIATATAVALAKNAIEKNIKRFEQERDNHDQAIEIMREEIDERESLRDELSGTILVLRRSLNRF